MWLFWAYDAISSCFAAGLLSILIEACLTHVQDWLSDSDDSDKFEWETDGEAEPSSARDLRSFDAAGPSTLVGQVITDFFSFSTRLARLVITLLLL